MNWFSLFKDGSITLKNGGKLITEKSKNLDMNFPQCPEEYNKVTLKENYDFFRDLIEGKIDLVEINSYNITEEGRIYKKCDYCKIIGSNFPYSFCKKCDKLMCNYCIEEKTEEDAKKNGAKNWHRRKNELLYCFSHMDELKVKFNIPVNCDLCSGSSKEIFGKWNCDRKNNKDLCPSCSYSKFGSMIMGKFNNFKGYYYIDENNYDYGSILDWVVIGKKENENDLEYLLYNFNKNSEKYKSYAYLKNENDLYKLNLQ